MSQENVEIVRRFYEAGQRSIDAYRRNPRADPDDLTAEVFAFLHPEIENTPRTVVEGGTFRGRLGWMSFWNDLLRNSEKLELTIEELEDLGDDRVFGAGMLTIKWKGSGIKLTEPRFAIVTLRDGFIVRIHGYRDRAEALEAAGLRE